MKNHGLRRMISYGNFLGLVDVVSFSVDVIILDIFWFWIYNFCILSCVFLLDIFLLLGLECGIE